MKHLLPKAALAFLTVLGLGGHEARASHAQGGDLRYEYIGTAAQPNRYRVTCRFFRDCSGIDAPSTLTLNARVGTSVTSCTSNDSRNFTATLTKLGLPIYGNQYCATTTGVCTSAGPDNYEENTYTGTVTLPPAQWILSAEENARPALANLANGGSGTLRFEASLNNQLQVGGTTTTLVNTSPNFGSTPAVFVAWQHDISLNMGAFDADGDSLAFSLVTPLEGCNMPCTYTSLTANTYTLGTGCTVSMPATPLSATYPLPSAQLMGSCPSLSATPYFLLDAATGSLRFTPIAYLPNAASSQGTNKYALTVKVDEFRRFNGSYQRIGSARREIFVNVYDCGQNQLPRFGSTMQVYGLTGPVPVSTPIPVRAGAATSLVLSATDANASQHITFSANHLGVPGVSIVQASANSLSIEFAPPATLPEGTYYVTVRADDDACPIRGFEVQTLAFRVTNTALSSHTSAPQQQAWAYPNPFTESVRFTLARPTAAAAAVEVVDRLGRVVERLPVPAGAGPDATLTWAPAPHLPAGLYLARFPNGQQTVRLLRMTN